MLKTCLLGDPKALRTYLPAFFASHIEQEQLDQFECHDRVNLISFDYYDIRDTEADPQQIVIYFDEQDLIFLCEGQSLLQSLSQSLKPREQNEFTLYQYFLDLIKGDAAFLEELEEEVIATEDSILKCSGIDHAEDLLYYRRTLFILKKYYEQLNSIFEGLVENENNLISDKTLRYFEILYSRIDRNYENVRSLRDYVSQVREAYQSQIDIEQNTLMKTFTVLTAVFLPLTLLVGWYGMNLRMPEFGWKYGYLFVVGLSIAIVAFCFWFFKKKKWF